MSIKNILRALLKERPTVQSTYKQTRPSCGPSARWETTPTSKNHLMGTPWCCIDSCYIRHRNSADSIVGTCKCENTATTWPPRELFLFEQVQMLSLGSPMYHCFTMERNVNQECHPHPLRRPGWVWTVANSTVYGRRSRGHIYERGSNKKKTLWCTGKKEKKF